MFIDQSYNNDIAAKVLSEGKFETDEPIFQELNKFLKQIGLDVAYTTFYLQPTRKDQSENRSDNGNDIGINLKSTVSFKSNGFDGNNNWSGKYPGTQAIKNKWKELAKQYGLPNKYHDFIAHVYVYDFEKTYLYQLLQKSKLELLNSIGKDKQKIGPEYIFCSSEPTAYNIIYDGFIDYYYSL